MNRKSIRFRILFWYCVSLFLATALIFSSFYIVTRQILFQQVDRELFTHADKLAEIATRQGINLHEAMLQQQLYNEFSSIPGMVVVLLDQNGSVVRSSLSIDTPYSSYQFLFKESQRSTDPTYVNQSISNIPMRFIAKPINNEEILLGVVLVAHPIEAIQKSLNTLLITLGFVFILLVIPMVLGGRILAAKIMRPISDLTDKMEEISSEHLEERVDNPESGDEIEKLVVTFNKLLDRLRDAFKRERQFIGDVAHELKTPVATLRGGVELALSKKRENKEYEKVLNETLIDVNRLSTTIKNILDLAWLGSENANLGSSHFDLSVVLNELSEISTKLAAQKHITLKKQIDPGIIVRGIEDKITRAILNVIDNAIKYTPEKSSVTISLSKKKGKAFIEIKDTGIGISQKDLSHIFERFYRGTNNVKTLGAGLGLAITQGIIKSHLGEIKILSNVGKGTSVLISLPLVNTSS